MPTPQLRPIDRASGDPPYRQIAAALREAIALGVIGPAGRLPSESDLMSYYSVARMTVRQAIQELKTEGCVYSKHGLGVFVRDVPVVRRVASERFSRRYRDEGKAAFTVEAEKAGYTSTVDRIKVFESPANAGVAQRLGIPVGQPVVVRDRRYLANGEPVETAVSYIPVDLARGTPIAEHDTGPGGIYARLEEGGNVLENFTEEVTARMPNPGERDALQLGQGIPVLVVVRTARDVSGRAVEVCETVKSALVYVLEYDFAAR